MIIFIKGPTERKRVEVNQNDKLSKIIKNQFEIESFVISYDENKNNVIDSESLIKNLDIKQGTTLYLHYDVVKKEINRTRDKMMCDHDTNAMCSNCAPLDPWDETYYKKHNIKYFSYGSYKEMCKHKNMKIEMENYTVQKCKDHPKNVQCVKCQEKDIYLKPQIYRMVDHIEFDDSQIVGNFIRLWKESRKQFFGVMVGRYMPYERSPLGLKAIVSGIWMPNQENYPDGFVLTEDINDTFLTDTGMEFVGMIYTDIAPNRCRDLADYFLSSLEIDFISKLQCMFPYIENKETVNSRFVTILATMNGEGDVELKEYQVTSQCMALTRNQHMLPTDNQDKFYTTKKVYYNIHEDGISKKVEADSYVPSDYFIVRLTHGNKQQPLFKNSDYISLKFSNMKMAEYLDQQYTFEKFSNFSFLMKIKDRIYNFHKLLKCIMVNDMDYFEQFKASENFRNLIQPLQKFNVVSWACKMCTYINEHARDTCDVCGSTNSN